jgi:hypothetical protein
MKKAIRQRTKARKSKRLTAKKAPAPKEQKSPYFASGYQIKPGKHAARAKKK